MAESRTFDGNIAKTQAGGTADNDAPAVSEMQHSLINHATDVRHDCNIDHARQL